MSYFSDIEYKQKTKENSWFEEFYFNRFFNKSTGYILDVGCATGNFIAIDPKKIEGIDIDDDSLMIAESRGFKVSKVNCDGLMGELPADYYSGLYAKHIIEHLEHPLDFLKGVNRTLKIGGLAIISTPNCPYTLTKNFFDDYTHISPFTKSSLKMIAYDAGFTNIKIYEDFRCFTGLGKIIRQFSISSKTVSKIQRIFGIRGLSLIMELRKD
jgi:2-polyprenyl-3-methyl-5-hydroxy-6-metoxy-1,4-benzoquinol methylase